MVVHSRARRKTGHPHLDHSVIHNCAQGAGRRRGTCQREAVSAQPAPAHLPGPTRLPPAGRLLWRSASAAQLEVGARRVVIDGVGADAVRHLIGREPDGAIASPAVALLQRELLGAGLLWRHRPVDELTETDLRHTPPHPRLMAEQTALSARCGEQAGPLLRARQDATVVIQGRHGLGPQLGAVLAGAGVGRVCLVGSGQARLQHAMPGGLLPTDEGADFELAGVKAISRHAPETDCLPLPFGERPDLVVLVHDEPVPTERRDALHAHGCAHLLVRLACNTASIGPLVLPGLSSCLRCTDLHRLDRDPAWNALAVQLSLAARAAPASEVALATAVAGLAAIQVLEFLDGGSPTTIEGALEMQLPDWRLRRRSWPVHPDCDCMFAPNPGS